jgi:acetoacetyl-[acyl-carrier protein] synthase
MTQALPVIVGVGGVNSAGRSSSHHATARLLYDVLDEQARSRTWTRCAS